MSGVAPWIAASCHSGIGQHLSFDHLVREFERSFRPQRPFRTSARQRLQVFPPFPSTFPVFRDAAQLERGTDSDDDNPRPVGVLDYHQLLLDLSYSPQFLPPTRSADAYLSKVTRMFPLPTTFPVLVAKSSYRVSYMCQAGRNTCQPRPAWSRRSEFRRACFPIGP